MSTDTTDTLELETRTVLARTPPDEARNAKRAAMYMTLLSDMRVDTQPDYDLANSELRGVKAAWETMEADRLSFTEPLNGVLGKINARFQPYLKTLKAAEGIIKEKMGAYLAAQQRRITDERAAAERAVAAQREQIEAQAAALRAQAQTQDAEARLQTEAQAQALEQTAAVVIAQPATLATVQKGAGISTTSTASYEVIDFLASVKHIANTRPDLIVLLKFDEPKVRAMVKMMGAHTAFPGLRVFEKTGISVR